MLDDARIEELYVEIFKVIFVEGDYDFLQELASGSTFSVFHFLTISNARLVDSLVEKLSAFKLDKCDAGVYIYQAIKAGEGADNIVKWLNKSVSADARDSAKFACKIVDALLFVITSLTTFAENAPENAAQSEKELIQKYSKVFLNFLSGNNELELVLFELQFICWKAEFPQGLLERLFKSLYDIEAITEDVYRKWKNDTSNSTPGKPQALEQSSSWFDWLEKAQAESEGDD